MLKIKWNSDAVKNAICMHKKAYAVLDDVLRDLARGEEIKRVGKSDIEVWVEAKTIQTTARRYFKDILVALKKRALCSLSPRGLHKICRDIKKKWDAPPTQAKEILKSLYNYEKFSAGMVPSYEKTNRVLSWHKSEDDWSAWRYVKDLGIRSCVYCNADTVFSIEVVIDEEVSRRRSALDHYYGHAKYPFAGITLSNLVPSCTRCNSNIKSVRELVYGEHIYPYDDSFNDGVVFRAAYASGKSPFNMTAADVAVGLVTKDKSLLSKRAAKSAKFFCLSDVYNQLHREDVLSVIQRELMVSRPYREFLMRKYPGVDEAVLDRIQNGMSLEESNICEHNLAKLTGDIVRQFRIG